MKNIKRFVISLSVLLISGGLALGPPASAHDGQGTDDDQAVTTLAAEDNHTSTTEIHKSGKDLAEQLKEQANAKIEKDQAEHQNHTAAERQKSCTARKAALTKRMANAVSQAKRHKAVFDKIYGRIKDFYTAKQLSVSNYAELTAKADTAQADVQTGIDALSSLNVSVDCTSQTVAGNVSAFQAAVKSTRDSLKSYRSAITNLITAVKGASTSTDNTSGQ